MKKTRLLSALVLGLSLLLSAGCSGPESPTPAPSADSRTADELAQAIQAAVTFSETLEPLDADVTAALYGLEEADLLDSAAYLSTGATAEECTVLVLPDDEAAQTALAALQTRVEDQTAALKDYQPQELPKLEAARTGTHPMAQGVAAYLVVAQDPDGLDAVFD